MKAMKTVKAAVLAVCVLATIALSEGCALLLVGGAAAGGLSFVKNTLHVTQEVSLDKAWDAANYAFDKLGYVATESKKDAASGRLSARNAQEQVVTVEVIRKTDHVTEIQITVGTFDTKANREGARQVYDKMKKRL